jgi:hypothetical protein
MPPFKGTETENLDLSITCNNYIKKNQNRNFRPILLFRTSPLVFLPKEIQGGHNERAGPTECQYSGSALDLQLIFGPDPFALAVGTGTETKYCQILNCQIA